MNPHASRMINGNVHASRRARAKGIEGREDAVGGRRRYRFAGAEMRVRFSTPGGLSSDKKMGAPTRERARLGRRMFRGRFL